MNVPYAAAASATRGQLRRLVDAAAQLDDRALLASSRCVGWTRAEVLVHVHGGLQDMLLALVDPTEAEPDTDAASYWRTDPPSNDRTAMSWTISASCGCSPRGTAGRLA